MTLIGTTRLYRPDPMSIGVGEQWRRASVVVSRSREALVLSVRGEVDASNSGRLADYVERHAAVSSALVVDTTALDFFGAPAIAALHRVNRCTGINGAQWRLVAGPALRRVMRACGTTGLPLALNVSSALRELGARRSALD